MKIPAVGRNASAPSPGPDEGQPPKPISNDAAPKDYYTGSKLGDQALAAAVAATVGAALVVVGAHFALEGIMDVAGTGMAEFLGRQYGGF